MSDNSPPQTKSSLERELLRLEKSLISPRNSILEERAQLRRQLNAMASPAHQLPFEALSIIFVYAVASPPRFSSSSKWTAQQYDKECDLMDIFFSVTLAAVCNRWRSVAFSTHSLWAHFEFPECLWSRKRSPCHLLSLYLHNSGHIPIHLSLCFNPDKEPNALDRTLFHPSLDRCLISNSTRIHSLLLRNPPPSWFEELGRFLLTDLSIYWSTVIPLTEKRLQVHRCHSLTRLSLHYAIFKDQRRVLCRVPTSLTVLDLSNIPIDACIKTMMRCPNLVEAYIHDAEPEQNIDSLDQEFRQIWFSRPVVFEHLTILLWTQHPSDWADAFLDVINTPRLHTLNLVFNSIDGELHSFGLGSLIENSASALKSLVFDEITDVPEYMHDILLHSQSSVEHLVLSRCTMNVLSDIFKAQNGVNGTPNPDTLPHLQSISIKGRYSERLSEWDELQNKDIEFLISSLERRLSPGGRFKVEFSGYMIDWTPVAQARLRGLIEKGIHLEIIEDGDPVEWLQ